MDLRALPSGFAANTAVAVRCVLLPSDSDSSTGRWIKVPFVDGDLNIIQVLHIRHWL